MRSEYVAAMLLILGCSSTGWAQTRNFLGHDQTKPLKVAIFVFQGVQVIDFSGPFEVFTQAGANVYTVGETGKAITTAGGLTITPQYIFDRAPKPDVLVLPGGDNALKEMLNPIVTRWIAETARPTRQVLTVCSGAFLAAKAGLLEGQSATTFYGLLDELHKLSPATRVVWDKKYVDSGNIVTTAGLSSGVEGSLYVVSKLLGMGHAQSVALNMEYNWNPDSSYARAMFPDMNIPDALPSNLPPDSKLLNSSGDRDHWTITVRIPGTNGAVQVFDHINRSLMKSGKWVKAESVGGENVSQWSFTDRFGVKWQSVISITQEQHSNLLFTLIMDRL